MQNSVAAVKAAEERMASMMKRGRLPFAAMQ